MRIVLCGAGQVGYGIAERLAAEQNDVSVVDAQARLVNLVRDSLDVRGVVGHGSHPDVLAEAGIDQAQADKSLETFNKRLGEMRLGVGAMKKPLEEYSKELSDQIMAAKSSEEAVKILIGAMEKIEDPATKAALASAAPSVHPLRLRCAWSPSSA